MVSKLEHDVLNAVGTPPTGISKVDYRAGIEQLIAIANEMGGGAPVSVPIASGNLVMPNDTAIVIAQAETGTADNLDSITFEDGDPGRAGRPIIILPDTGDFITLRDVSVSGASVGEIALKNPSGAGTVPSLVLSHASQFWWGYYDLANTKVIELMRDPLLSLAFPQIAKSGAFTASPYTFYMCTGTTYAIALSAAGAYPVNSIFEGYNAASGDLTLTPAGAVEKIGGDATLVIGPKQAWRLRYTGVANYEFVQW